ncbi:alpha/beta hydrolase [Rhodococcoides fascians]|uniref:alpha/beta hydrolase n=1 Tax=Rhodococcoides fascians TaxID=1828 RepID=UPI00050BDC56|nr:alpha/beta hydrolase [Rhodococcus fascians]
MSNTITERIVTFDGHRIFLRESGTGPLVLLLHGWPESSYAWRHQIPALASAGFRVVAYDGLGYGRSSKPPRIDDYRITEHVAVAAGLVHALGEEKAHLVGHDWGAIVSWTAAWTRPDVFSSVVGLSVPFSGRGQFAFPGSPFGELRPSVNERQLAGPDHLVYKEYFDVVGRIEAELDADVRGWLRGLYFYSSAPSNAAELPKIDPVALSQDELLEVLAQMGIIIPKDAKLGEARGTELPAWMSEEELEVIAAEYDRTGTWGALNWYRNTDLNWEILGAYEGKPVTVPAYYIGAEYDPTTIWGRDAISRMHEHVPDLRGQLIIDNVGHYMASEGAETVNAALIGFLQQIAPDTDRS